MAPLTLDQWYTLNIGSVVHVAYCASSGDLCSLIGSYQDIIKDGDEHVVYFDSEATKYAGLPMYRLQKMGIKMGDIYHVSVLCDNIELLDTLRLCNFKPKPLSIIYTEPLDNAFTYPIRGYFKALRNGMLQLYHKSSIKNLGGYTCYYSLENIKAVKVLA